MKQLILPKNRLQHGSSYASLPSMLTVEERMKALEQEIAGMKAILGQSAPVKNDWESIVGTFESDPLFKEALRLGREYRESQPPLEDREGA